jgi:hypothetical protein
MKLVRAHFFSLAWILVAVILLNGLACSLGHGVMHGQTYRIPSLHDTVVGVAHHAHHSTMTPAADEHKGTMHMAASSHTSPLEQLAMSDCAFAGTLPLALLMFAALGWLLRYKRQRLYQIEIGRCRPPRDTFSCINPRAP